MTFYQGSGRFGGAFDEFGVMTATWAGDFEAGGSMALMHQDYFDQELKFAYGEYLPIGSFVWSEPIQNQSVTGYFQEYDPNCGTLCTRLETGAFAYQLQSFFNPGARDRLELVMHYRNFEQKMPALTLQFLRNVLWQKTDQFVLGDCCGYLQIQTLSGETPAALCTPEAYQLTFPTGEGEFKLILVFGAIARQDALLKQCGTVPDARELWQKEMANPPDLPGQWHDWGIRAWHHMLCSFSPDGGYPAPPCGWSSNNWKNFFPMDLSFVHPLLLSMGRVDIVKGFAEFYYSRLDQVQEYTRRLFDRDGAMWFWEFPPGTNAPGLEAQVGEPNYCFYELHNAAYPAKTALEAAFAANDRDFLEKIAYPILTASAKFFASCAQKADNGRYDLVCDLYSGQDEAGGHGGKNYLCSLYAAEWTLRAAVAVSQILDLDSDLRSKWQEILSAQWNFDSLLDPQCNLYAIHSRFNAVERLGKQKHPVQLNRYWSFPGPINQIERNAWECRHQLCMADSAMGWTQAVFVQGAANQGLKEEFEQEIELLEKMKFVDADFLQLEESPPDHMAKYDFYRVPYYVTNEAMILQAFLTMQGKPRFPEQPVCAPANPLSECEREILKKANLFF